MDSFLEKAAHAASIECGALLFIKVQVGIKRSVDQNARSTLML